MTGAPLVFAKDDALGGAPARDLESRVLGSDYRATSWTTIVLAVANGS